jgi:uncharacterized protein (DUF362 family)
MKKQNVKKKIFSLLIILFTLLTVGWDFSTSLNNILTEGTFRYESEFDAVSSETTKVAIVPSNYSELSSPVSRTTNPSYNQIEAMVRKAIELQGGLNSVVKEGDNVVLKVNLVESSGSGNGGVTDVRVVKAVIKIIDEISHGKIHISVAEGSARSNDDPTESGSVWELNGYTALLTDSYLSGIDRKLVNLNGPITDLVEITIPEKKRTAAPYGGKFHVHKVEANADVYISIPVLKIHTPGITCALKNQIGTAPGTYYGYNKQSGRSKTGELTPGRIIHDDNFPQEWTYEEITDLSTIAGIDFVVVDAIMCLEREKSYSSSNKVRMNTIIAGKDPVAVDHVCAKIFCINPDDIGHITLAAKVGLGTNDADKIYVVGSTIESVKKKVVRSSSITGQFGQSNRTWILSKEYPATDISTEPLTDEANLEPISGQNEWSQPVYFFDDRIDLLDYYKAQTNIITYAFSYFYAPKSQTAKLAVGCHEGMYVYINGTKAYSFSGINSYGDYYETATASVQIKKGFNKLLVKTLNQSGDFTFALNIRDTEGDNAGSRVAGLKFMTDTTNGVINKVNYLENKTISIVSYPNPAVNSAFIDFEVPNSSKVNLDVFDLNGKHIVCLVNEYLSSGKHQREWNISENNIKPGIYVCRFNAGKYHNSTKIIVK